MLNIGIIGFGKMGRLRFDAVKRDGRGRVTAVFDPHPVHRLPEVKFCCSAEEVISDPNIDCIFICTPNYLNKSLTIQALENGKHVFCEKPPALSSRDMEEVIASEGASPDRKLMYGFNHRHHESMKKIKEIVDSGAYGRLLWMRGRYGKSVDGNFYNDWRSKKKMAGGGILMDQGIHMLDLFLVLADDFEEVEAYISNLYWKLDVEDNVFAIFRNRNGVVASLHSTMTQWRHLFSLEVFLEKGYIVLNGLLTSSASYGEEVLNYAKNRSMAPAATWDDEGHISFKVDHSWQSEINHFFECIIGHRPIEQGHSQDALKLMRLIDKVYAKKGKGEYHG